MVGVAYSGKHNASTAKVVCPGRDRPGAQSLERQAVDILCLQKQVLRIFVIRHIVLLVIHHKCGDAFRDRMFVLSRPDPKGAQRRMTDKSSAHYFTIVFATERDVAGIMQRVQPVARVDKFLDSRTLLFRHPRDGLTVGKIGSILQVLRIIRPRIRTEVAARPILALAQNEKNLVVLKQIRSNLVVFHGVVDGNVQLFEYGVKADTNVVGVVMPVPDKCQYAGLA